MSKRSRQMELYTEEEIEEPSRCSRILYYTWKVTTCLFSHTLLITMVVAYCIFGAFTFEHLEADNERKVKRSIMSVRNNVTEDIWKMTYNSRCLHQDNWTITVIQRLKTFETDILKAMKKDGWDGNEDEDTIQWTFTGALFYSIIVITTIGYGHIAPKTHWGKVVTIFYAILGIPLMLLCLSNIGDIMATSFRFLYWRVCCYVCTRKPKRRRALRSGRSSVRIPGGRHSIKARPPSNRRPARISQRSTDSGFGFSENRSSYSDTELRNNGKTDPNLQRILRRSQISRFSDSSVPPNRRPNANKYGQYPAQPISIMSQSRGGSLDRRRQRPDRFKPPEFLEPIAPTPILSKKFNFEPNIEPQSMSRSIQSLPRRVHTVPPGAYTLPRSVHTLPRNLHESPRDIYQLDDVDEMAYTYRPERRAKSAPRQDFIEPLPLPPEFEEEEEEVEEEEMMDDYDYESQNIPKRKDRGRGGHRRHNPSPRIMSPMGFAVSRQYYDDFYDESDHFDDMYYYPAGGTTGERRIKPVPIWLCVFLVVSYILGGAFLFNRWENWKFLDSAYFCFITLTTIGFGDFVPAKGVKQNNEVSIALCSLYLLFGISLLAMSFNLVQEEVIANVKSVAKRLGIIKADTDDDSESDD